MALLRGLMSVFEPNPRLPLLYWPTLYCRMLKPKKSNPASASDIALSVCTKRVLEFFNFYPIGASHCRTCSRAWFTTARSLWSTTKSSAYRIISSEFGRFAGLLRMLLSLFRFHVLFQVLSISSILCRPTLASKRRITPPCGVPTPSVKVRVRFFITPAFNHVAICRLWPRGFVSSASWSMVSKHLQISASCTYLPFGARLIFK